MRRAAGLTTREVADYIQQVTPEQVTAYERGDLPIPDEEREEWPGLGMPDLLLDSVRQCFLEVVTKSREIEAVKEDSELLRARERERIRQEREQWGPE